MDSAAQAYKLAPGGSLAPGQGAVRVVGRVVEAMGSTVRLDCGGSPVTVQASPIKVQDGVSYRVGSHVMVAGAVGPDGAVQEAHVSDFGENFNMDNYSQLLSLLPTHAEIF